MERLARGFAGSVLLESMGVVKIMFKDRSEDDLNGVVGRYLVTLGSVRVTDDEGASYILDKRRWVIGFQLWFANQNGIAVDQAALDWAMR